MFVWMKETDKLLSGEKWKIKSKKERKSVCQTTPEKWEEKRKENISVSEPFFLKKGECEKTIKDIKK